MPKFRKKPLVIEAIQFNGLRRDLTPIMAAGQTAPDWLIDAIAHGDVRSVADGAGVVISTLEGAMGAKTGDWIVRGVAGELYPCRPDIFAATYDPEPS